MVYFIGIGGIGMSALARFFNSQGKRVAGYDLTSTPLTNSLSAEGIEISFTDEISSIPDGFRNQSETAGILIVYTPAIPADSRILEFFRDNGYNVLKRSKLLGILTGGTRSIAVAGTHGKTSVSTMIAHLLNLSSVKCDAFLGGVSKNYNSNLVLSESSELMVVEADEYDRSFLQLFPNIAIITSMDPDHLDIYGSFEKMREAFLSFAGQVKDKGTVIYKYGLDIEPGLSGNVSSFSYGFEAKADYYACNLRIPSDGMPFFDIHGPGFHYKDLRIGVPGRFNVENATAAVAAAHVSGANEKDIRTGLNSFTGIHRRFDVILNMPGCLLIDDYAHHPAELSACISAVRETFPGRKLTGIFQPHLFTRTRDFAEEFAESLEKLDELILLDIYPAREKPLPGVTSELIYNRVKLRNKFSCTREQLVSFIQGIDTDIVITLGAGNIDAMVEPVKRVLLNKISGTG